MCVALLVAILTYVVPAGQYDRVDDPVTGRTLVVEGTYQPVDPHPATLSTLFGSLYEGFQDISDIIALILIAGGAMGILIKSGAIHAGINSLTKVTKGKNWMLFAIIMIVYAFCSSLLGMAEEFIGFVPILCAIAISLGYDKITGIAILLFGIYSGVGFALTNPFNIVIAQQIAQLPIFSGMGLRAVGFVGSVIIAIHHVIHYGNKVKKDPTKSLLYDKNDSSLKLDPEISEKEMNKVDLTTFELTGKRKLELIILAVTIIGMGYGTTQLGWWMHEMCAIFLAFGIVIGLIEFKSLNETVNTFMREAGGMAEACLLIAMSRSIVYIMSDGMIIDTIVRGIATPLGHLNGVLAAWAIYISQLIVNFFVPSSSGQAVVVMPILTPLADLTGISRQVMVHAFMAADSYGNMIIPTHPTTLACLGMAGISYNKWFKLAWPLVLKWTIWSFIILAIGVYVW
ncbi:MAG: YfcC family protein [Firmicutes bacterium]|nr:YfcC family protein [Bacillota bacterium]